MDVCGGTGRTEGCFQPDRVRGCCRLLLSEPQSDYWSESVSSSVNPDSCAHVGVICCATAIRCVIRYYYVHISECVQAV